MKKISMYFYIVLVLFPLSMQTKPDPLSSDSLNYLPDIDEQYHGIYFNNAFIENLKFSGSISKSFKLIDGPILYIVNKNIIYSNDQFYDGYAIENSDYNNWSFKNNGVNHYLIDNKGRAYIRHFLDKYYIEKFDFNFMSIIIQSHNFRNVLYSLVMNDNYQIIYDGNVYNLDLIYPSYYGNSFDSGIPDLIFRRQQSDEIILIYYNDNSFNIEYCVFDHVSKKYKVAVVINKS